MNPVKMLMRATKMCVLALLLMLFGLTTTTMAAESSMNLMKSLPITEGAFSYERTIKNNPTDPITINAAIVSLSPENETGVLDSVKITGGPDGAIEFGCKGVKVKNGSDLIKACGGPAALKSGGNTTYAVQGSKFGPDLNTKISVKLVFNS